jgi:uncharacterized protein (TIGR00266 family)
MEVEVKYSPAYALAFAKMSGGEVVRCEAGSMVSMSTGITIQTSMQGGLMKSLARKVLTSESFFINTYTAPAQGGDMSFAPGLPGDLTVLNVEGTPWLLHADGFVACENGVEVDTKWGGVKTMFGGEGPFTLHLTGHGKCIVSTYGAVHLLSLAAGETLTVDSGHLVAWPEGIGFRVRRVGGMKSFLFSGEGLVIDLTGPAQVLMQTRSTDSFLSWLVPRLPTPGNRGISI